MKIVLALFIVIGAVLHYVWEANHIGLYTDYGAFGSGVTLLTKVTAGDVMYSVFGILVVSIITRSLQWISMPSWKQYGLLALYGCIVAILIEWKALYYQKWAYLDSMPITPFIHVGLSPVLQMTILLPASLLLAIRLHRGIIIALKHK